MNIINQGPTKKSNSPTLTPVRKAQRLTCGLMLLSILILSQNTINAKTQQRFRFNPFHIPSQLQNKAQNTTATTLSTQAKANKENTSKSGPKDKRKQEKDTLTSAPMLVTGIWESKGQYKAYLNDEIVSVGEQFKHYKVIQITDSTLTLLGPNQHKTTLILVED